MFEFTETEGTFVWQSDWNGDEVGYDDVNVVGLYCDPDTGICVYVDSETGEVLEVWEGEDD
jgi:hypothetical protein